MVTALFSAIVTLHIRLCDRSLCQNFWSDQAKLALEVNNQLLYLTFDYEP